MAVLAWDAGGGGPWVRGVQSETAKRKLMSSAKIGDS